MTMGTKIRTLRQERKMTQEELGKYLGVGRSAILKYENGEVSDIPASKIQKMAELFGVSPSSLMCFDQFDKETLAEEKALLSAIKSRYGKDVVKLLDQYLSLNDDGKKRILSLLEDISSMEKYLKVQGEG